MKFFRSYLIKVTLVSSGLMMFSGALLVNAAVVSSMSDSKTLLSSKAEGTILEGEILEVRALSGGFATHLILKSNLNDKKIRGVRVTLKRSVLDEIEKKAELKVDESLAGKMLRVKGELKLFNQWIQLECNESSQWVELEATAMRSPSKVSQGNEANNAGRGEVGVRKTSTAQELVVDVRDTKRILQHAENTLTLQGKVASVGKTRDQKIRFINFVGNGRSDFTVVVFLDQIKNVAEQLGEQWESDVLGKTIQITGSIEVYQQNPQIKFNEKTRLKILENQTLSPSLP